MKVVGILLAAGFSTRFGANKLLAPLPSGGRHAGLPVAVASARNLAEVLPESLAVVRPRAQKVSQLLREAGCRTVICRSAARGMGISLAAGVRATGDADGWVIALADMPYIRAETIRRIALALQEGAAIAAPACGGERGHPVGLASRFRDELLALTGDEGARQILAAHADCIRLYETGDRGILRDIDVPGDLARGV
ncbi:MAG: hypothetical protein A3G25_05695 [Betaproteobacteria bacterium RIFCSPLOWO2_12_FULL_63_13]|nr:MAG: hypothetical protein A3G25_05695 [Betaproteobacteria bacterium RIFCSPLOWO2_12_FULL_63_13]